MKVEISISSWMPKASSGGYENDSITVRSNKELSRKQLKALVVVAKKAVVAELKKES